MEPALVLALVLFATLITSAYTDIVQGKIYNWCTYPAIAVGVASYSCVGGWGGLTWSLVGLDKLLKPIRNLEHLRLLRPRSVSHGRAAFLKSSRFCELMADS